VFREAHDLGVVQLGLSGGEPTLRPDLAELVRCARGLGLYSTLVTSAHRLKRERLAEAETRARQQQEERVEPAVLAPRCGGRRRRRRCGPQPSPSRRG